LSIDVFFGFGELKVHVCIGGGEFALILLAPLELDADGFSSEVCEEWFGVDDYVALSMNE
jgi:hypothetical protein